MTHGFTMLSLSSIWPASARAPSTIDRLPTELVFAMAKNCESSADAAALCRARWGDDVVGQAAVDDFLHRARLWGGKIEIAKRRVHRPAPWVLENQTTATKANCRWLGVDVGLLLAGLVCASTFGSALLTAGTPASPIVPRPDDFAARQEQLRAYMPGHFVGTLTLLGWIPAGYLIGNYLLAPAFTQGALARGKIDAAKHLLGESEALLSALERQKLCVDLYKNIAIATGSGALCAGVVLGAFTLLALQAHATAVAVFAYGLTKTASITLSGALGALVVTYCTTDAASQTRSHLHLRWQQTFTQPASTFYAEGYHAYIDLLTQRSDFYRRLVLKLKVLARQKHPDEVLRQCYIFGPCCKQKD